MGGPMSGGMQHDDAFAADMHLVRDMLFSHDRIKRTVTNLPNGIKTVTESDDPQVAQAIQTHVASMVQRLGDGKEFNLFSKTIPVLFENRDKISTTVEITANGAVVTQTSSDAQVVTALQVHATEVDELVRDGMAAMMRGMMARTGGGVLVCSPRADEYSGALRERLLHLGPLFGSDDSHEQLVELGAERVVVLHAAGHRAAHGAVRSGRGSRAHAAHHSRSHLVHHSRSHFVHHPLPHGAGMGEDSDCGTEPQRCQHRDSDLARTFQFHDRSPDGFIGCVMCGRGFPPAHHVDELASLRRRRSEARAEAGSVTVSLGKGDALLLGPLLHFRVIRFGELVALFRRLGAAHLLLERGTLFGRHQLLACRETRRPAGHGAMSHAATHLARMRKNGRRHTQTQCGSNTCCYFM